MASLSPQDTGWQHRGRPPDISIARVCSLLRDYEREREKGGERERQWTVSILKGSFQICRSIDICIRVRWRRREMGERVVKDEMEERG